MFQGLTSSATDRNGNTVTINWSGSGAFTYTDELGRTALSSTGFGTAAGQSYKVYVSGLSNPYTIYWGSATANFGVGYTNVTPGGTGSPYCNGVGRLSQTAPAISEIVLPNGQAFHFYYDSTYGLLDEIIYPSGGWIKYTWEVDGNGSGLNGSELAQVPPEGGGGGVCSYVHGWPRLAEREVSFDGSAPALTQTFSYTTTWGSSPTGGWTSKETDVATTDNVAGTSQETFYTYTGIHSATTSQWEPSRRRSAPRRRRSSKLIMTTEARRPCASKIRVGTIPTRWRACPSPKAG